LPASPQEIPPPSEPAPIAVDPSLPPGAAPNPDGEVNFEAGETVEEFEPADTPTPAATGDVNEEYVPPGAASASPEDDPDLPLAILAVKLRALNKITAKSQEVEAM